MKKQLLISSLALALSITGSVNAQNTRCWSDEYRQLEEQGNPSLINIRNQMDAFAATFANQNSNQSVQVTIPVVFHVVWNTASQNISDAKIFAQMSVLNNDYAKLNSDTSLIPAIFKPVAANTDIQFCLAQRDPNGNPTTGIVRSQTTVSSWSQGNTGIKYTAQGGQDAWDRTRYLNVWVCNLGSGLLGYATFPGGSASLDGVVVLYSSVGGPTSPGSANPYHLGRTLTHEVGHWLNLYHTFQGGCAGTTNNNCLSAGDQVCDTPPTSTSNFNCPGTQNTCTETSPFPAPYTSNVQDQTMNYMDYVNDACMYMFSLGQKTRIQSLFATGGLRSSLLTSNGCVPLSVIELGNKLSFEITPNPSSGVVNINLNKLRTADIKFKVYNVIGQQVYEQIISGSKLSHSVNLSKLSKGVYTVVLDLNNATTTRKLVIE